MWEQRPAERTEVNRGQTTAETQTDSPVHRRTQSNGNSIQSGEHFQADKELQDYVISGQPVPHYHLPANDPKALVASGVAPYLL